MFPIEAIKQSRSYTLFADDFFALLELLIADTPYRQLSDEIALEFIFHYLYQNSHVPDIRVLYTDFCDRLARMINQFTRLPIFQDSEDLHELVTPLLAELDLLFHHIVINHWGVYSVEIALGRFEVSYVGDYRILTWSQSQDAKRFKVSGNISIFDETNHAFKC